MCLIIPVALAIFVSAERAALGQGILDRVREDVREPSPETPSSDSDYSHSHDRGHGHSRPHCGCDDDDCNVFGEIGKAIVLSPFWLPHTATGDDFSVERTFKKYPYEDGLGYMATCGGKRLSAQFSTDYATEFSDLDQIGGRLLVDTASRWGIDTEMKYFQESVPPAGRDSLWLGDCNMTFRFAQSEKIQWRAGLGFNWLDDPARTDFGFNFTYGFDWFPRDPWVVSAEIDWGTLGHSGLFHFRGTVGVMVDRLEVYTGYEYFDFDSVQTNMLIGGVRIWF